MAIVSMKNLLEAGVHFGHQTRRWHPKMKPYIFTERNDIYILDLRQTLQLLEHAHKFVSDVVAAGDDLLFVGTKKQAQEAIGQEAARCEMPFVNRRWLGGTLTNFATIYRRIERLRDLEEKESQGYLLEMPKKEQIRLKKEKAKLEQNLGGLKKVSRLPGAIFVVDPRKERIAVMEARRKDIPVLAIVDTNCDPDEVDNVIPGNDDAIRSITLITRIMADAVLEGRARRDAVVEAAVAETEKQQEASTVTDAVAKKRPAGKAKAKSVAEPKRETKAPGRKSRSVADKNAQTDVPKSPEEGSPAEVAVDEVAVAAGDAGDAGQETKDQ